MNFDLRQKIVKSFSPLKKQHHIVIEKYSCLYSSFWSTRFLSSLFNFPITCETNSSLGKVLRFWFRKQQRQDVFSPKHPHLFLLQCSTLNSLSYARFPVTCAFRLTTLLEETAWDAAMCPMGHILYLARLSWLYLLLALFCISSIYPDSPHTIISINHPKQIMAMVLSSVILRTEYDDVRRTLVSLCLS